jgi:hypothetical protein
MQSERIAVGGDSSEQDDPTGQYMAKKTAEARGKQVRPLTKSPVVQNTYFPSGKK